MTESLSFRNSEAQTYLSQKKNRSTERFFQSHFQIMKTLLFYYFNIFYYWPKPVRYLNRWLKREKSFFITFFILMLQNQKKVNRNFEVFLKKKFKYLIISCLQNVNKKPPLYGKSYSLKEWGFNRRRDQRAFCLPDS